MSNVPKISMCPDGPQFSQLVQGYWRLAEWQFSSQECLSFLKSHVEMGITTVDNAHVYGNPSCEQLMGDALALDPSMREQIEIVTKCGIVPTKRDQNDGKVPYYDASREHINWSVDLSLSRMKIDVIDVLLLHRPDFLMNADEVAEAFTSLRQSGKVKHFGVSNFTASQFALLQSRLDFSLVTNQVEINPFNTHTLDDGTLDQLQQQNVSPMAWSCLGGGRLFNPQYQQGKRLHSTLTSLLDETNATSIEQLIYAWVLKLPSMPVPIIGSGKAERVKLAVDALNVTLTQEQWYRIWVAAKGHNIP